MNPAMPFSPEGLAASLTRFPRPRRYLVAFSGGLDSTVLLSALTRLRGPGFPAVAAVHVDHGLHPRSAEWSDHCARVCARLAVPIVTRRVDASPARGESPEAVARQARYQAIASELGEHDLLLTAHHRSDQAETVLLRFLRGAGARGLAGMPASRPLGTGALARPLLAFTRDALFQWAQAQGLAWIDDPSNFDIGFERNWLRRTVLPELASRRPGIETVLVRNGLVAAETAALLDEIAREDLTALRQADAGLSVAGLERLSAARAGNVLRHWLNEQDLPVPDARNLTRVFAELLPAAQDAEPIVAWPGVELRRYRGSLYALAPLPAVPPGWTAPLTPGAQLELPDGSFVRLEPGPGIALARLEARQLRVGYRQGGELCRPPGRGATHSLKKLLQEAGIPPWKRRHLPLLWADDELVAVAGLCVDERFVADDLGPAVRFTHVLRR